MVATRSSRSSSRLKKKAPVVDTNMEDKEDKKREETEETSGEAEAEAEDTSPKDKNDIGCKQCLEEGDPSKTFHKKASQVRFNEVVETREVETEYDKPDRTVAYIQGFLKRVVICTVLVMLCKTAWPYLQPVVWPETPIKEGKLYILNDRSFRSHISNGDHFVMMMAPWCGHCKKLKPDWDKLARQPGVSGLSLAKVDCTKNKMTCDKYDVKGYPTLLYFRDGKMIEKHSGSKDLHSLKDYVKTMRGNSGGGVPKDEPDQFKPKKPKAKKKKDSTKKEL